MYIAVGVYAERHAEFIQHLKNRCLMNPKIEDLILDQGQDNILGSDG
jgi:hypothetical protein